MKALQGSCFAYFYGEKLSLKALDFIGDITVTYLYDLLLHNNGMILAIITQDEKWDNKFYLYKRLVKKLKQCSMRYKQDERGIGEERIWVFW